jgi:hypothetical protein
MTIAIIRLLLDFGLVVLIWIIQRIVYPSFLHYTAENLIIWHKEYTSRFSVIVIPLMIGQLGISMYQAFIVTNLYTVVSLVIVIIIWLSTFLQFVPVHSNISKGQVNEKTLNSLVAKNWLRTFLWSLLFVMNFIVIVQK